MIEKVIETGILFDFYGNLLSSRQYSVIESFYILDLSLAEIGEELNITRQSVHDTLKRAEANLSEFENKLRLVRKFKHNNHDIVKIIELSNDIEKSIGNTDKEKNNQIIKLTDQIKTIGFRILKNN